MINNNAKTRSSKKSRTNVEELFLSEMVEEDMQYILNEDNSIDDIIPVNTIGLFDDTISSSDDEISNILLSDDEKLF